MKTYRIFLASSFELKTEREQFEIFINRENKRLAEKNVFLRLEIWEDMDDAFNTTCKQEDYNEYLRKCDIFVMLFWSKVGRYTLQEFDLAYQLLHETGKPHVFVYEKTLTKDSVTDADKESKALFIKQIQPENKEQFHSQFAYYAELENRFKKSLDELFEKGILTYGEPATLLSPNGAANPNVFIGREDELKEIRKRLDNCGKLMLINAEGGIGKTTLAAKYWNESLYDYKHNAWLFCDNGIVNALKELAPKLNVDLAGMDEHRQIIELQRALSGVHDDFLLVLDNANDDKDIHFFRQTFEGFHWHVLITSRCQGVLDKEEELPISHLPPPLAKALFERYYQEKGAEFDSLLHKLLLAIEFNTLLIELFSKNLKKARMLSLKDFLENLEKKGLYLGEDNFRIETAYNIAQKKGIATTDEIIEILYDVSNLEDEDKVILLNILFLPAKSYELNTLEKIFTNYDKISINNLNRTLERLFNRGWISGNLYENYRTSPVVKKIILRKFRQFNNIFKNNFFNICKNIIERNLECLRSIKQESTIIDYKKLVNNYTLINIEYAKSIIDFFEDSIERAFNLSELCFYLSFLLQKLLRLEEAKKYQGFSIEIMQHEIITNEELYANSLDNLGWICRELSNFEESIKYLLMSVEFKESTHLFSKIDTAFSYHRLAGCYKTWGDLHNAYKYQVIALEIRKKYLPQDNLATINSMHDLAAIYISLGDLVQAKKMLRHIIKIRVKEIPNSVDTASSFNNLAQIELIRGNYMDALYYQKKAHYIFENVLFENHIIIGYSYMRLAWIYSELGEMEFASNNCDVGLKILEKMNNKGHLFYTIALFIKSLFLEKISDINRISYINEAISIQETFFYKKNPDLGIFLCKLVQFLIESESSINSIKDILSRVKNIYEDNSYKKESLLTIYFSDTKKNIVIMKEIIKKIKRDDKILVTNSVLDKLTPEEIKEVVNIYFPKENKTFYHLCKNVSSPDALY